MKTRTAAVIAAAFILTAQSGMTVSAAPADQTPKLSVCPQSDCILTENHYHDGTEYMCHTTDDGHTYHSYCGQTGCTQTGEHRHSQSHTASGQGCQNSQNKGHNRHNGHNGHNGGRHH